MKSSCTCDVLCRLENSSSSSPEPKRRDLYCTCILMVSRSLSSRYNHNNVWRTLHFPPPLPPLCRGPDTKTHGACFWVSSRTTIVLGAFLYLSIICPCVLFFNTKHAIQYPDQIPPHVAPSIQHLSYPGRPTEHATSYRTQY